MTMLGVLPFRSLTAWQMVVLTHDTPVSAPTPAGTVSFDHVPPPLVVPIMAGEANIPNPTAVQTETLTQEMPDKPLTDDGVD
jgi:hypothetical protein